MPPWAAAAGSAAARMSEQVRVVRENCPFQTQGLGEGRGGGTNAKNPKKKKGNAGEGVLSVAGQGHWANGTM